MSLDGYVADRNDGVAEVFDWYSSTRSPSTSRRFFLAQESDSLTDSPARQSFLATRL
jgi:hypothetical protein